MLRICVVDGQGGGIGSLVVSRLREAFEEGVEIIALGTNAIATSAMLKAGANRAATGENAIVQTVPKAHIIIGSVGVVLANAMLGELTPSMAASIGASQAMKILIPVTQERVRVAGVRSQPLPHLVEEIIEMVREEVEGAHV
jgi:hypothetical protein